MRLYSGRVPAIAQDVVKVLREAEAIEAESPAEVVSDVEAVLKEYLRQDREIGEEARNRMERKGLSYQMLSKVRNQVAEERGFPSSDEFLPYVLDQLLEMLLHSQNVDEVFVEDVELRKLLTPVLRKHLEVEAELDREIRGRLKHLTEGTAAYEIEYQKLVDQMKRKKHLA